MENIEKFLYNANRLNKKYTFIVNTVSTISNPKNNSIIFLKKNSLELLNRLESVENSILILLEGLDGEKLKTKNLVIYSENPRLEYAILISKILELDKKKNELFSKNGYYYGENVSFGKNVRIEPFVKIGKNVKIGDNTVIKSGAIIDNNVIIGNNCYLREHSVVGAEDFGIETFQDGSTIRIPHIGGVILNDFVEVGMFSTVCGGTIEPTIVEEYVKIDTMVNVGHNTRIGRGTLITAGSIIGGSTIVGENCNIGLNTSIKNGIEIGHRVITGMSSIISKSVGDNEIMVNEQADTFENIKKYSKYKKKILEVLSSE